jgi:2-methylcitrate dehydratase PrpD
MGHGPDSGEAHNPYTRGIAAFIATLKYEAIPEQVRERIKLLILDSFGCAIFGAGLPWSKILIETLSAEDQSTTTPVWGTGKRLSSPHAALVNGTLVQGFEIDDVHRVGVLHVGAVTLPAVLAVAGRRPGMTGRDFLRACVAGYEIGPRVGMCMGPEHIAQGWHSGATVGVYSAVAGAAAALELSADQAVHALGIAGTQSSGLMAAQFGAMVKRMHAGRAAQSGLYGALLAARGFTGIVDVFENPYGGFCSTFSRSTDRFDLAKLTAGLGTQFEIMRIALKFYSCVGSNHTTLDALRTMRARQPFGPDDVEEIVVEGSRVTVDHVGWSYVPQGLTSAQLNLPYCVATLLLDGDVFVDQFTEEDVTNPERIRISQKVKVIEDPSITARGAVYRHMVKVRVKLKDGTRMEETVEAPRGSEHSFASAGDVIEKFVKLASRRVPRRQVDRVVDSMMNIEKLENLGELIDALIVKE